MNKHTLLITGAAGYVGAMLVQKFAVREDVATIIALDKEPLPEILASEPKLVYIQKNTADNWEAEVQKYNPDIVIHAAWQIREMYGKQHIEREWNIGGSEKLFDYCFGQNGVKRLVYFSTVASYGAFADNSLEHRYTEAEPFRWSEYAYAEEKRVVEESLIQKYATRANKDIDVAAVRPAAITGPRGRYMRIRFGLQATLAGQMKDAFIYRVISAMVSFVPITPKWLRQFIHEDDIVDIVELLAFDPNHQGFELYNMCPSGEVVLGKDMAKAVGKKTVTVYPWMVRTAFFVFWHLTRGKVPTGRGAWRGYSYPIAVDGSKLTRERGYVYKHSSLDAFYYTDGVYEEFVPPVSRRSKK